MSNALASVDVDQIAAALSLVRGVEAVVLGGSRSRGEAMEQSDYDIGVYYDAGSLDITQLDRCLRELDDSLREGLLNPPGAWGPWINGGAWLAVGRMPVDVLLRDTGRVREVLNDCLVGKVTIDYQCGHPFGFVNMIYAAEVHYCRPLWQGGGKAADELKAMLTREGGYPEKLRRAAVQKFVWEARFSLACGWKPALAGETNYAIGSAFRAVCAWAETLYALNGKYLMNEKGALKQIDKLPLHPGDMEERVNKAYSLLAAGNGTEAFGLLEELHAEVEGLSAFQ